MEYDINRPWATLDKWQKDYVFDKEDCNNFLLTGRQVGKTTAMSLRAVELCMHHYKKGEFVLINSITEKQAYHLLAKAKAYATEKYTTKIKSGQDRPTMHKLLFKNGTGILCYAAGEEGEGLRGLTIKKLMPDEGSRMSEEYFIAVMPQLSVVKGTMDIASTPSGRLHKDGSYKFFYERSQDPNFKKYYISAEDCPRHTKEFLANQEEMMSSLAYAQEYKAEFLDAELRLFDEDLINKACVLSKTSNHQGDYFIGVDVAGLGRDDCTYEIFELMSNNMILQRDNMVEKRNYTTDTTNKIISLDSTYNFVKIGVDDGGVGFGVYSELLDNENTKRRTIPLNNSSRPVDHTGTKSRRLLKEEMYFLFRTLMEKGKLQLLDTNEMRDALASVLYDEGKILGNHISEGGVRGVWIANQCKGINIWLDSIKI